MSPKKLLDLLLLFLLVLFHYGCQSAVPRDPKAPSGAAISDPSGSPSPSGGAPAVQWSDMTYALNSAHEPRVMFLRFDGLIEIGASSEDRIFAGYVEDAELRALHELIENHLTAMSGEDKCEGAGYLIVRSRSSSKQVCIPEKCNISELFTRLLEKHSPEQMSRPCKDAVLDFERGYRELRACDTAEDCSYIGNEFLPIEADHLSSVQVDDCSHFRPLIVANVFEVVSRQLDLLIRRDLVNRVCDRTLYRSSCSSYRHIETRGAPPVCIRGECRVNPALSI
ncbi:MAG: hypothetical protein A2X94_09015 [Bdellovibrionales bacterium GWB1_55_8]|nr:MAG: hypothetical protein A2X94_09015 [Bdellovibrionales bacterium GWB1_55_8]